VKAHSFARRFVQRQALVSLINDSDSDDAPYRESQASYDVLFNMLYGDDLDECE
jgi:hypothetical protein